MVGYYKAIFGQYLYLLFSLKSMCATCKSKEHFISKMKVSGEFLSSLEILWTSFKILKISPISR